MFQQGTDYLDSYYSVSSQPQQVRRPRLEGEVDADVVIVGAGYTGLYTALNLAEAGLRVVVIEASRVGWGASGRNGGQIILGFSCDMPPFEAALGLAGAREVWRLIQEAAGEIRSRIVRHEIDCDLAEGHLWTSVQQRRVGLLTGWQEEAASKWGYEGLRFIPKAELPQHIGSDRYQAALLDRKGGHLHPLKYVLGLARAAEAAGVRIYEDSQATSYARSSNGVNVQTCHGRIQAGKLVLACNAYIDKLDSRLQSRVLPVGTYIIATEPLGEAVARQLLPSGHAVSDNQFILDYFRMTADHRLLFGGKCTYTGKTPRNLAAGMRADMLKVFPQLQSAKVTHAWGGHIDITMPRTPDFGCDGDVYWAQGFSGHGIVPTCVAGRVLAEAIRGDDTHLKLFTALRNPPFPGGEKLGALFQAVGMSYYRLRDYF